MFASEDIKKNEDIYLIRGNIKEYPADKRFWADPNAISFAKNRWISPSKGNPLRYTNHSCSPNAIVGKGLKVVALKKIKQDDEITIDYSLTEDDPYWRMKCDCGSRGCRGTIFSIHHLPKEIFRKYRRYLSKWLINSYKKSH